jgi:hypothetical protein
MYISLLVGQTTSLHVSKIIGNTTAWEFDQEFWVISPRLKALKYLTQVHALKNQLDATSDNANPLVSLQSTNFHAFDVSCGLHNSKKLISSKMTAMPTNTFARILKPFQVINAYAGHGSLQSDARHLYV